MALFLGSEFKPGEHFAVWAPNSIEWGVLELATALAGITLVMINPALQREEVLYALKQSRSAGVFLVDAYRNTPMAQTLADIRAELPYLRAVYRFEQWADYIAMSTDRPLPQVSADMAVMIQYTSGTTGNPK